MANLNLPQAIDFSVLFNYSGSPNPAFNTNNLNEFAIFAPIYANKKNYLSFTGYSTLSN